MGPEALEVTPAELAELFAAHPMRLHGFLRDQHMLAGLGRRLANEICHRAKLSPFASTAKLGPDGAERVVGTRSRRASTSRSPTSAGATT